MMLQFLNDVNLISKDIHIEFSMSMTRICHNYRLQTNPQQSEEESKSTDIYVHNYGPRREKTYLRGFRPCYTQTAWSATETS